LLVSTQDFKNPTATEITSIFAAYHWFEQSTV